MRKSRFSEEQIIGMIREHEAGVKTADICRKYGISDATFYKYKAKFGGMTVSDARRLKTLEEENSKLQRLLADKSRGHHASCTPAIVDAFVVLSLGHAAVWTHDGAFSEYSTAAGSAAAALDTIARGGGSGQWLGEYRQGTSQRMITTALYAKCPTMMKGMCLGLLHC